MAFISEPCCLLARIVHLLRITAFTVLQMAVIVDIEDLRDVIACSSVTCVAVEMTVIWARNSDRQLTAFKWHRLLVVESGLQHQQSCWTTWRLP